MITKYYKVRQVGTESYLIRGIGPFKWDNFAKGKLYTRHAVAQLIRYWAKHRSEELEKIEVVEYDLLERRGIQSSDFLEKVSKTPILD